MKTILFFSILSIGIVNAFSINNSNVKKICSTKSEILNASIPILEAYSDGAPDIKLEAEISCKTGKFSFIYKSVLTLNADIAKMCPQSLDSKDYYECASKYTVKKIVPIKKENIKYQNGELYLNLKNIPIALNNNSYKNKNGIFLEAKEINIIFNENSFVYDEGFYNDSNVKFGVVMKLDNYPLAVSNLYFEEVSFYTGVSSESLSYVYDRDYDYVDYISTKQDVSLRNIYKFLMRNAL